MAMHPGLLPTLIPNHDYISLLHSLYQHRNSELFCFFAPGRQCHLCRPSCFVGRCCKVVDADESEFCHLELKV